MQVAKELGPDKIVVVIICDSGDRYLSKCYNDVWMKDMGYFGPSERLGSVREVLQFNTQEVEFAEPEETLANVAKRMADLGISQMPVKRANDDNAWLMIHEVDLLHNLVNGESTAEDTVLSAAKPLQGIVNLDDSLTKVQGIFDDENVAVAVENGEIKGIITKIDMVEFLASR